MNKQVRCIYCKSNSIKKNGKQNGKQRYKCKSCGRTFTKTSILNKYIRGEKDALKIIGSQIFDDFKKCKNIKTKVYKLNNYWQDKNTYNCYMPKMLISIYDDGNKKFLMIFPIPKTLGKKVKSITFNSKDSF